MNLQTSLKIQQISFKESPLSTYEERVDRIDRIGKLIIENQKELTSALNSDFGARDRDWTLLADFVPIFRHIKYNKKNLKNWMKRVDKGADSPFNFFGAKAYIQYEPLGVVGIIIPWNVPISLAFHAALEAFAAGNRVMIKFSEHTPKTGELLKKLVKKYFKEEEMIVITGEVEVSIEFSKLPFDHLLYTGGSNIGKSVMKAAADNLTPITLELGGKSPVIVSSDADINFVAKKIVKARYLNSGQVCLSPDYVFLPEEKLEDFISLAIETGSKLFPHILKNDQYTSIINDHQYERIIKYIDEAKKNNVRIVEINPENELLPDKTKRKIPLVIMINPEEELKVSQEEIFGPILILKTYKNLSEAIEYINSKPKPLALYYFGDNEKEKDLVVNKTSSGGVCINDVMLHAIQDNLAFGGVGASGMGRYGGYEGFKNFSNPKSVFEQGKLAKISTHFLPPFNKRIRAIIENELNF